MPEFRKDPVTGRWVIIATERGNRPSRPMSAEKPRRGGYCPFCPGNETATPSEVLSYRPPGLVKDSEGWWLRTVPNKFPALRQEGTIKRSGEGMYDLLTGYGAHEVIIESPNHENTFADLPEAQIEEVVWAMRDRSVELRKDPQIKYVLIFKNWGEEAGASQEHPHCQIISLPIVPKRVQEELDGSARYYDYKERCVFCDMLNQELNDGKRIVCESESFVSFMPFASRFPFETWIVPRDHEPYFYDIQKNQVQDLSRLMKKTFSLLKEALNDPPYNFLIHTTPFHESGSNASYHWHIEIMPKLTRVAGFEWGSGFYINPTTPEEAAKLVRETNGSNSNDLWSGTLAEPESEISESI